MKHYRYFLIFCIILRAFEVQADLLKYVKKSLTNRLPKHVIPKKYIIAISPNFMEKKFYGAIHIDIRITRARHFIALHAKNLTITSTKLYKNNALSDEEIPIDVIYPIEHYEMIVIETSQTLKSHNYVLRMNYTGSLSERLNGFYLSTYTIRNSVRKLAVTQFEPVYARTAFPCFDEPSFKSIFHIRIVHSGEQSSYRALSNMPAMKVEKPKSKRNLTITSFAPSPLMSTYSVAFLISDFERASSDISLLNGSFIPLSIYVRSTQKDKVQFSLNVAMQAMEFYSSIFQIDYPLPKLDLVGIPDFAAGAMENWGLVTFRETELLYSEEHSSCKNMKSVSLTIAHELAHMWFGDLVTMKWWNDLWLNEGFATYMEFVAVGFIFPEWKQMEMFALNTKHVCMSYDSKANARPIINHPEASQEIGQMFNRISYQKGAAVIKMLENTMGDYDFVNGIRRYLKKYKFSNANSRDLFESLQMEYRGRKNIVHFMNQWTTLPGFPVVNVQRSNKITFRLWQQRFVVNEKFNETYKESWDIPLKYVTSDVEDGVNFEWLLADYSCVQLTLAKPVDWIKFNHNSVGYYIVNYTECAWTTFTNLLLSDNQFLNPIDRADLLYDAFLLGDSVNLSYHTVLNLTTYLITEMAFQPWSVASQWIIRVNRLLHSTDLQPRFKIYVQYLIDKIYRDVGWNVEKQEQLYDRELRSIILNLACSVEHADCLRTAAKKLKTFVNSNGTLKPHPDIRSIVYSFGLFASITDRETVFDKIWKLFLKESDVQEKKRLVISLAAVKNRRILSRYLETIRNERFVRRQDFFEVLVNIAANPLGLNIVWDFIKKHWEDLVHKFTLDDHTLGTAVGAIISMFKDENKLEEVRQFFNKYPNAGAGAHARMEAIENVKGNIKWLKSNLRQMNRWFTVNEFTAL